MGSSPSTRSTVSSTSASTTGTSFPVRPIRSWGGRTTPPSSTTRSYVPRPSTRSSSCHHRPHPDGDRALRGGGAHRPSARLHVLARRGLHSSGHVVGCRELGVLLPLRVPRRHHEFGGWLLCRSYSQH